MQVDLEELEHLANAAISHASKGCSPEFCEAMDSFRATSNAEAVLALIARVRELEAQVNNLRVSIERAPQSTAVEIAKAWGPITPLPPWLWPCVAAVLPEVRG